MITNKEPLVSIIMNCYNGEKYVYEHLKKGTSNIGSEPNGHIMMFDYGSTGDGMIAALQVLAVFCKMKK